LLIADSAATAHVIKNPDMLQDPRAQTRHVINNMYKSTETGSLGNFGEAILCREYPRNVFSLPKAIRDGFAVSFDMSGNKYTIKNKSNEVLMEFGMNHELGLYTYEWSYSTVVTKAQEEKIKLVQQLEESLCFPSDEVMIRVLKNNNLLDCPLTGQDFRIMREQAGVNAISYAAKVTAPAGKAVTRRESEVGKIIHVDIFYIQGQVEKVPFLMTVDEASGYMAALPMATKSKDHVIRALKAVVNAYSSYGHKVRRIVSDSEANLVSCAEDLGDLGVEHVAMAERGIRTLKEKARAIKLSLGYDLPTRLWKYLVRYVSGTINYLPNSLSGNSTPYELVRGRKVRYKDLTGKFGDVSMFRIPRKGQDLDPRAQLGIIVGRNAESGSVQVYIPESNSIVIRKKYVLIKAEEALIKKVMQDANSSGEIKIDDEEDVVGHISIDPESSETDEPETQSQVLEVIDLSNGDEDAAAEVNNLSVKECLKSPRAAEFKKAMLEELQNMIAYQVWTPVRKSESRVLPSMMFLKDTWQMVPRLGL
jgi:hypothetical protein